jgi:hypothetical protein
VTDVSSAIAARQSATCEYRHRWIVSRSREGLAGVSCIRQTANDVPLCCRHRRHGFHRPGL